MGYGGVLNYFTKGVYGMKVVDFKKEFDEKYELLERFNQLDRTKIIVIENDKGVPLILFVRDQEVLTHIKVEKG